MTRDRAVATYYLYMAASSIGFLVPVWVVLLEDRGLSLTAITLLDAAFFATLLLSEIPTGYVGDRIGRRTALAVSAFGLVVASVGFGLAQDVGGFLAVYVVWGVAQTLRSGNDSAWLYDTLAHYGEVETFGRVRSRGMALLLGAGAVTAVVGGWLYTLDPVYPFLATGVMQAVAGVAVLALPTVEVADGERFTRAKAARAVRRLFRPHLRWFVVFVALFWAVGWSADVFVQPVGVRAGFGPLALGALYAVFTGVAALATNYADSAARRLGTARVLHLAPVVVGVGLLTLALTPLAFLPAVLLMRTMLSGTAPVVETYLNDRTPSLGRATVLSAFSMTVSLLSIPLKLVSGPFADATSPFLAVAALGGLMLVGAVVVLGLDGWSVVRAGPVSEPAD